MDKTQTSDGLRITANQYFEHAYRQYLTYAAHQQGGVLRVTGIDIHQLESRLDPRLVDAVHQAATNATQSFLIEQARRATPLEQIESSSPHQPDITSYPPLTLYTPQSQEQLPQYTIQATPQPSGQSYQNPAVDNVQEQGILVSSPPSEQTKQPQQRIIEQYNAVHASGIVRYHPKRTSLQQKIISRLSDMLVNAVRLDPLLRLDEIADADLEEHIKACKMGLDQKLPMLQMAAGSALADTADPQFKWSAASMALMNFYTRFENAKAALVSRAEKMGDFDGVLVGMLGYSRARVLCHLIPRSDHELTFRDHQPVEY